MSEKPTYEELKKRIRELEFKVEDLRKSEKKTQENEALVNALLEAIPIPVFYKDRQGSYLGFNTAFEDFFGEGRERLIGKTVSEINPRELANVYRTRDEELFEGGDVQQYESQLKNTYGEMRDVIFKKALFADSYGVPKGLVGAILDITDRKQAERALRESEEQVQAKLDAILSPDGDIRILKLGDVVNAEAFQSIMDDFYRLTNIGVAVLDMEGRVVVATGWQDICTKFHRIHPETAKRCLESHLELSSDVTPGTFKLYRCKNHMWNIATPIMVGGKHLGNLFLGQFLFDDELPDYDVFREQARQYGFDEIAYIEGLDRIPRWSRDTVDAVMRFYTQFANLISQLSYSNLKLARTLEDRRKAEDDLRQSEARFRTLLEASPLSICAIHKNQYIFANPEAARVLGYDSPESIVGLNPIETVAPEYREVISDRISPLHEGQPNAPIEIQVLRRDGERLWTETTSVPIELDGQSAALVISRDISEERLAEKERARLLSAIEQSAEIIVMTDSKGTIQYVNPAFERVTGYASEEVMGQNSRILKSGAQDDVFYRQMWQTISAGKTWKGRMVNKKKDGSHYTEEVSISPVLDRSGAVVNFVAVKRDVTSEIDMEKRLAQAQKMEAIGNLAGGIAHDFNNILSPILIHSELAMMELPEDSPLQTNMKQITVAGERASELVKQILTFARRTEKDRVPLKASLIVKEAVKFLRSTTPSTVQIHYEIIASKDTVFADPSQMHQIVMNLCTNAVHAMEETGGMLQVRLEDEFLEENNRKESWVGLHPGQYLKISVSDTGIGIHPDIIDKIFEPYFTTKGPGQGTGLGLAVIHGIVQSYGGDIHVESETGKGTTFRVLLPIAEVEVLPNRETRAQLPRGDERILFVDDEPAAIAAIQPMLASLGYRVTSRNSSTEALELFRRQPHMFDLVITDQTMPHMTGKDLVRHMMAIRPDIPIVLCTGFSAQIDEEKAMEMGIKAFVLKPIVMKEMAHTIRNVLGNNT